MNAITTFCAAQSHFAPRFIEWMQANCQTLQQAWDEAPKPWWLISLATVPGVLSEEDLKRSLDWSITRLNSLPEADRHTLALDLTRRLSDNTLEKEVTAAASDMAFSSGMHADTFKTGGKAWSDGVLAAWEAKAAWLRENTKPLFSEST